MSAQSAKIKGILDEIQEKNNKVQSIFDEADGNAAKGGVPSSEDMDTVKKLNREIADLEAKAADLNEVEAMRLATEKRREGFKAGQRLPEMDPSAGGGRVPTRKSLGQQVFGNEEFEAWRKSITSTDVRGIRDSPKAHVEGLIKTLITGASSTSAGALIPNDYQYQYNVDAAPFRDLTIMDLITSGSTDGDLIEFAKITSKTNNAASVAEATATTGSSGTKPESAIALAAVQVAVKTIAHWLPATTRSLQDAGQIRTIIDTFLREGLRVKVEDLVVSGDGVGENFTGILNTAGLDTQAFASDLLVTTRKARTSVKTTGRVRPTAYAFNPIDWEAIDLTVDGENRFFFGGPSVLGTPRLWGVPVVESEAITAGRGLLADWRYAVLWDRMQESISVSNSHADFFTRNMVAILAELRAAFAVTYPAAFCDIDLTA